VAGVTVVADDALHFVFDVSQDAAGALPQHYSQSVVVPNRTVVSSSQVGARTPVLFQAPRSVADIATARHTAWAGDMGQINDTMGQLGMRALRQSGGDWAKAEALLAKYGDMMNKRFQQVGSTKRAVREAAVWNNSGLRNGGRGTRAPSFTSDGNPIAGTSRLDLAIESTALPGNPIVSGFDISLSYFKMFKLDKYKKAFGETPMSDVRFSRNLSDPNAPMKNYIKWFFND